MTAIQPNLFVSEVDGSSIPLVDAMEMLGKIIDNMVLDDLGIECERDPQIVQTRLEELVPESMNSLLTLYEASAPAFWKEVADCIYNHPVVFFMASAIGLTIGIGLAASAALFVGIGLAVVSLGGFALQLAVCIETKREDAAIVNILRDLKFAKVITPVEFKKLQDALSNRDAFRLETYRLLPKLQQSCFASDQLENLAPLITNGSIEAFYELIAFQVFCDSLYTSDEVKSLIELACNSPDGWHHFFMNFCVVSAKKKIHSWISNLELEDKSGICTEALQACEDDNQSQFKQAFLSILNAANLKIGKFEYLHREVSNAQGNIFTACAALLSANSFYQEFDARVMKISRQLEDVLNCDIRGVNRNGMLPMLSQLRQKLLFCFEEFGKFLKEHLSVDEFELAIAKEMTLYFQGLWITVNDLYEKVGQKLLGNLAGVHLTCGCHLAPVNNTWQYMENNVLEGITRNSSQEIVAVSASGLTNLQPSEAYGKPKILIFTSKAGGGNKMVTRAAAETLRDEYHIVIEDLLDPFEICIWNNLAAGGWWKLMKCLMDCAQPNYESTLQKYEEKVREAIERVRPAVIVTCCPSVTPACHEIGSQHNIPTIALATDYEALGYVQGMPGNSSLLTIAIPSNDEDIEGSLLPFVGASQVEAVGYPSHPAFYPRELTEIISLKAEFGIPPSAKVVSIIMGSLGCGSSLEFFSEKLFFEECLLPDEAELHVFVFCGANTTRYQNLVRSFEDRQNRSRVIIRPISLISQAELARYYAVTDLLVTKPGGSTLTEAAKMGCKILIDDTTGASEALFWEKSNILYFQKRDLAEVLKDLDSFSIKVYEMLNNPSPKQVLTLPSFKESFTYVIEKNIGRS